MYNFNTKHPDGQSLVHVINLMLGDELIGAELGVGKAQTLCTLLQNCPNIKLLYGVDSYKPYAEYLDSKNGKPIYCVGEKEIEFIKLTAHHNIKFSGYSEKVKMIEEDSSYVSQHTQEESLDFVFLDTCMTYEQQVQDLNDWYSKVKVGGLFSGHDWNSLDVQKATLEFRKINNITQKMSCFDNTWMWIK